MLEHLNTNEKADLECRFLSARAEMNSRIHRELPNLYELVFFGSRNALIKTGYISDQNLYRYTQVKSRLALQSSMG